MERLMGETSGSPRTVAVESPFYDRLTPYEMEGEKIRQGEIERRRREEEKERRDWERRKRMDASIRKLEQDLDETESRRVPYVGDAEDTTSYDSDEDSSRTGDDEHDLAPVSLEEGAESEFERYMRTGLPKDYRPELASIPPQPPQWGSTRQGARNFAYLCKDTISKDNTIGEEARMDGLLARVGKKMMKSPQFHKPGRLPEDDAHDRSSTGSPIETPPRRELPRIGAMPTGRYSRHIPGVSRAQTYSGAYSDIDPRGRGRARMQSQSPESDSEEEYERARRELKAHRSKKNRSPESRGGKHLMRNHRFGLVER